MSNTVKIVVGMSVGYIGRSANEVTVDTGYTREEWDILDAATRAEETDAHLETHVANHLNTWWREAEED